jgi:hypothetical protein
LKTIITVSTEELRQWAEGQWSKLQILINEAAKQLPAEYQEVIYDDQELKATLLGGAVTVQPEVYEAKSIKGIREKPGWGITSWRHQPETECYPADFVPSEEKNSCNTIGAAVIAVKLSFDVLLEDWGSRQVTQETSEVSTVVPV